MKVTLINPPYYFRGSLEYLSQNLGIGYLAAVLLEGGHNVNIIDALAEGMDKTRRINANGRQVNRCGLSYEEIVDKIPGDVDMIGITGPFSYHATIIDELTAVIKGRLPSVPIVLGGIYPSTQPARALQSSADFVVVGEGEGPIAALAAGKSPSSIPGVWYMENGRPVDRGRSEFIADPDVIPFPARHLLPMDKYLALSQRSRPDLPTAAVITSRGCPFDCTFCSIHPVYSRKWRPRSPGNIMAEIDLLIEKWNVKFIEFEDDNLTLDPERAREIFKGLIDRQIHWSCSNGLRVDSLDRDLLELMKKSGIEAVHLAIESGDPVMLKEMNKKLDLHKVEEVLQTCHELDIPTVAFIILGHPGETEKSFRKNMQFVARLKKMGMVACGVHIATPYPGTRLLEICRENGWLIDNNVENKVMMPGDVHIATEEFSRMDILSRVYRMRVATNMLPDFTGGIRGFYTWKVQPRLSAIGMSKRKYAADLPDDKLDGFYGPEKWFDGITYRWSKGNASIKVKVPGGARVLKLFMKSNRVHQTRVLLDYCALGLLSLRDVWTEYSLEVPGEVSRGEATLRFFSDAASPSELGYNEITRVQGFILSWYEFER